MSKALTADMGKGFSMVNLRNFRRYYLKEAAAQGWSVRTLERNINTFYYQRLLSSKDKPENHTQNPTEKQQLQDFIKKLLMSLNF